MSINWVMLSPQTTPPFTPLPGEQTLYTSPPRVALSICNPPHYPGKQLQSSTVISSSGLVYLTSRRIIYLPSQQTEALRSFAAPFLNLHDSHVTAPFFGPNVWYALLKPVSGGGINPGITGVIELKLTFKDGGAFDFHSKYEQLKERAQQVAETASMTDHGHHPGVDLEDLPVYQEENDGPLIPPIARPVFTEETAAQPRAPPSEPPPGYEEAHSSNVRHQM